MQDEAESAGGGDGSVALTGSVDSRSAVALAVKTIRNKFDASGTVWAAYERMDGGKTCHDMDFPNAPDIHDCGVRIESMVAPGRYEIVPPDGKYAPEEISEPFLIGLGGGRKYRVSLRWGRNTIPRSYLTFELEGRAERHAMPHEEERDRAAAAEARAAATATPAKPPASPVDAASTLALGADPVAALIGSAVKDIADPGTKLAFALAFDRGVRAEALRQEQMQRDERLFQFMGGLISTAARGQGGGGDALALLREQNAELRRRQDDADRRYTDEAKRARDLELAAARGSTPAPAAPNPFLVAVAQGVANGLPGVMTRAVEMAGPEAARAVVSAGAQMAGAVAG